MALTPDNYEYKRLLDSYRLLNQDHEAEVWQRFAEEPPQRLGRQGKLTTAEVFYVDYCIKVQEGYDFDDNYFNMLKKHITVDWLRIGIESNT